MHASADVKSTTTSAFTSFSIAVKPDAKGTDSALSGKGSRICFASFSTAPTISSWGSRRKPAIIALPIFPKAPLITILMVSNARPLFNH
jgi:hypothetical protein